MSVKSIKRALRDTIYTHMTTQMSAELSGVDVEKAFAGAVLAAQHIRIVTGSASPDVVGARNTGRWTVNVTLSAVSQIDDYDGDSHDNLVGLLEAYALQGNATLCAAWTDNDIAVEVVHLGDAVEVVVESILMSSQELICECRMKG